MNTRTLRQTVTFKASPRQVYELLMDAKKHTSLSGEKAKISREARGRFTAWNGHITGFNLVMKPGEKIVQAWRATGWWPDHYPPCGIRSEKSSAGNEFTQMGIPPARYSGH